MNTVTTTRKLALRAVLAAGLAGACTIPVFASWLQWCFESTWITNCKRPWCNQGNCQKITNPRSYCDLGLWYCPSEQGSEVTLTVINGVCVLTAYGRCDCPGVPIQVPGTADC